MIAPYRSFMSSIYGERFLNSIQCNKYQVLQDSLGCSILNIVIQGTGLCNSTQANKLKVLLDGLVVQLSMDGGKEWTLQRKATTCKACRLVLLLQKHCRVPPPPVLFIAKFQSLTKQYTSCFHNYCL